MQVLCGHALSSHRARHWKAIRILEHTELQQALAPQQAFRGLGSSTFAAKLHSGIQPAKAVETTMRPELLQCTGAWTHLWQPGLPYSWFMILSCKALKPWPAAFPAPLLGVADLHDAHCTHVPKRPLSGNFPQALPAELGPMTSGSSSSTMNSRTSGKVRWLPFLCERQSTALGGPKWSYPAHGYMYRYKLTPLH